MPLEDAPVGSPGFGRNIATEERAGKPPKQAEAIAYAKARGDASRLDTIMERCDALMKRMDALNER